MTFVIPTWILMRRTKASPTVCQIRLLSLFFWKNTKNMSPTVLHTTWQILGSWQKEVLHAQICARVSGSPSAFLAPRTPPARLPVVLLPRDSFSWQIWQDRRGEPKPIRSKGDRRWRRQCFDVRWRGLAAVRSSGHSGITRRPLIISQAIKLCGLPLHLGLLLAMALRSAAPIYFTPLLPRTLIDN